MCSPAVQTGVSDGYPFFKINVRVRATLRFNRSCKNQIVKGVQLITQPLAYAFFNSSAFRIPRKHVRKEGV